MEDKEIRLRVFETIFTHNSQNGRNNTTQVLTNTDIVSQYVISGKLLSKPSEPEVTRRRVKKIPPKT